MIIAICVAVLSLIAGGYGLGLCGSKFRFEAVV